jgi:thioredoxin-like negative regulator of GroEL
MKSLLAKIFGGRPDVIPTHLSTRDEFARYVLQSDVPVIVDVWSETCAPCKQLVPVLIKVATKYEGKLRVAELSTQAEPSLLAELAVRATPTILVFEGGVEIGRMAGYRPAAWFDDMISTEFPELNAESSAKA